MGQLIKPQIHWTEKSILALRNEYPSGNKQELAKKLGISRTALKGAARRFGVKSTLDKNLYKLKSLLEESPLSYYWMGFIMADGHLDREGELKVTLSVKDADHLNKLAKLLAANMTTFSMKTAFSGKRLQYCRISCKDSVHGREILKKFNFSDFAKTYNPPSSIPVDKDELFLSFLIGFIDGDGCFSKKNGVADFIKIESHGSWINILTDFRHRLGELNMSNVSTGTNSRGYCYLKIYKHQNLKFLKEFAIANELPILERKWDSVDTERILKRKTVQNLLRYDLISKPLVLDAQEK